MKRIRLAAVLALCAALSGCALMPAEEQFRTAPLIREYQREEFPQAPCTRGDLSLSRTVNCYYVPVRTESLKYPIGGLSFDAVFVTAGDHVEEGQLLAQLNLSDIEQNIESTAIRAERLETQLSHLDQDEELALEKCRLQHEEEGSKAVGEAQDKLRTQYEKQRVSLNEDLEMARLRLTDYREKLKERQLIAPISGTVTYVRRTNPGDVSVLGDVMITIADSTLSLFRAETDLWDCFTPGQIVEITSSKVAYEAAVTTEAELGLPETERVPGKKSMVYFALTEPTFELEDNDRGTLTVELDSRKDVLRVPESAVRTINGATVVYYEDEEGMKAYKPVEAGLTAEGMTEIISGLEEGELVITE